MVRRYVSLLACAVLTLAFALPAVAQPANGGKKKDYKKDYKKSRKYSELGQSLAITLVAEVDGTEKVLEVTTATKKFAMELADGSHTFDVSGFVNKQEEGWLVGMRISHFVRRIQGGETGSQVTFNVTASALLKSGEEVQLGAAGKTVYRLRVSPVE